MLKGSCPGKRWDVCHSQALSPTEVLHLFLGLKLALRQEYLSAILAALPVFKLPLSDNLAVSVCAKEGVNSLPTPPCSHFSLSISSWRSMEI